MAVPPKFYEHNPVAWWEAQEAQRRQEFAQARAEAVMRQGQQASLMAEGRAYSQAERRHREMLKVTAANRPRGLLEGIPPAWIAAAGLMAYRAWKRSPMEVAVGYRRAPGDPVTIRRR